MKTIRGDWLDEGEDLTNSSCWNLIALIVYCLWFIWLAQSETPLKLLRVTQSLLSSELHLMLHAVNPLICLKVV